MRTLLRREWLFWAILATMFLLAATVWPWAPDRLPIHWNVHGEIDWYAGKFWGLFLLPLSALGVYLLMLLIPRVDPGRENYPAFARAYLAIRLTPLVVCAVIYVVTLVIAFGVPIAIHRAILPTVGMMLLVLGNYMGKIRPNWFVGIRTPWTLSSKLSWTKTHRLGGWVFMGIGLVSIVAAALPGLWSMSTFLTALLLGSLVLVLYSYCIWRHDPQRIPPAGTGPVDSEG